MKNTYLITRKVPEGIQFFGFGGWGDEYPDAELYETLGDAAAAAEELLLESPEEKFYIVRDYGCSSEKEFSPVRDRINWVSVTDEDGNYLNERAFLCVSCLAKLRTENPQLLYVDYDSDTGSCSRCGKHIDK